MYFFYLLCRWVVVLIWQEVWLFYIASLDMDPIYLCKSTSLNKFSDFCYRSMSVRDSVVSEFVVLNAFFYVLGWMISWWLRYSIHMDISSLVGYAGAHNADMNVSFLLLFGFFWGGSMDRFNLVSSFDLEYDRWTLRDDKPFSSWGSLDKVDLDEIRRTLERYLSRALPSKAIFRLLEF